MSACRIWSNSPPADEVETGGGGEAGIRELFMKSLFVNRERTAAPVKGLEKISSTSIGIGVAETESICFVLTHLSALSAMESLATKGEERQEAFSDAAETGEEIWGEGARVARLRAVDLESEKVDVS